MCVGGGGRLRLFFRVVQTFKCVKNGRRSGPSSHFVGCHSIFLLSSDAVRKNGFFTIFEVLLLRRTQVAPHSFSVLTSGVIPDTPFSVKKSLGSLRPGFHGRPKAFSPL